MIYMVFKQTEEVYYFPKPIPTEDRLMPRVITHKVGVAKDQANQSAANREDNHPLRSQVRCPPWNSLGSFRHLYCKILSPTSISKTFPRHSAAQRLFLAYGYLGQSKDCSWHMAAWGNPKTLPGIWLPGPIQRLFLAFGSLGQSKDSSWHLAAWTMVSLSFLLLFFQTICMMFTLYQEFS